MKIIKWLHKYFTKPAAYYCKPLLRDHEWRAPKPHEKRLPICKYCGAGCWWSDGYRMNSGTYLAPDLEAQKIMVFLNQTGDRDE